MANELRKRRVLVIGLDGATFEILTPLVEKGFPAEFEEVYRERNI